MNDRISMDPAREQALDVALARALPPPALPSDFRSRLAAAVAREAALESAALPAARERLEREQQARLQQLDDDFVRLRRHSLGTLIGGTFAAGAAVALALPWLQAHFGPSAMLVLAVAGTAIGLALGALSWASRLELPPLLRRS